MPRPLRPADPPDHVPFVAIGGAVEVWRAEGFEGAAAVAVDDGACEAAVVVERAEAIALVVHLARIAAGPQAADAVARLLGHGQAG